MTSSIATHASYTSSSTRRTVAPAITVVERRNGPSLTLSKQRTSPAPPRSPAVAAAGATTSLNSSATSTRAAVPGSEVTAEPLNAALALSSSLDALSLDAVKSCDGVTEHFVQLLEAHKVGQDTIKLSLVSAQQFDLIQQIISQSPKVLGKPRFSYFGKAGFLFVRWPSDLHETPIRTLDEMLAAQGTHLPFPKDVVATQIHHNKALRSGEDTIIPDVSLTFVAKDDTSDPIYPVICQIAFSQPFEDALDDIRVLAAAHPSICMAIIIDIKEKPAYQGPISKSGAWKTLSHEFMSYTSFINLSSYHRGSSIPGFSANSLPKPLTVGGHTWCSLDHVTYHVWLKGDLEHLNVDAATGDHYAFCTSPGRVGWDSVEALLLRGLIEVKKSLVSYCETIICDMQPSPNNSDLTPLYSHETTLPISLQSFDEDILRGIKLTSHGRYENWFSRSFRGAKRPHAGKGCDAAKKPRNA